MNSANSSSSKICTYHQHESGRQNLHGFCCFVVLLLLFPLVQAATDRLLPLGAENISFLNLFLFCLVCFMRVYLCMYYLLTQQCILTCDAELVAKCVGSRLWVVMQGDKEIVGTLRVTINLMFVAM